MAIGIVLLIASMLKFMPVRGILAPGNHAGFPSHLRELTEVTGELVLGLLLVGQVMPALIRIAALLAFSGFAVVTAHKAWSGLSSCGCFGDVAIPPAFTFGFDVLVILLLLLSSISAFRSRRQLASSNHIRILVIAAAAWVTIAFTIPHMRPRIANGASAGDDLGIAGSQVVLQPKTWIGRKFPLAERISQREQVMLGRWVVMLVYRDCDHCISAVSQYVAAMQAEPTDAKLAIIEMPSRSSDSKVAWAIPQQVLFDHLDSSRTWFAVTPVAMLISDGTVIAASEGDAAMQPDQTWWKQVVAPPATITR